MDSNTQKSRYEVIEVDGGQAIAVRGIPGVLLRLKRGLTVGERGRTRYPQRTIFLDGVFNGPPFYDNSVRHYSLDHHVGCVRAFTLATCEQAVVMLLQGLPLEDGSWTIWANDPDMDTVLASWLLLNHEVLLADDARLLGEAMPLVRVEGVIDAHGLEMARFSALPDLVYKEQKQTIDRLMEHEREIKNSGKWDTIDFTLYTLELFESLDLLLLPAGPSVEAVVDVVLTRTVDADKLAVLCRSEEGIYEIEVVLKERFGKSLGVIVLDRGRGRYSLRQTDPFLKSDLRPVYTALNAADPFVDEAGDGVNHWGGASDIGGSPRQSGSGLDPTTVLDLLTNALS